MCPLRRYECSDGNASLTTDDLGVRVNREGKMSRSLSDQMDVPGSNRAVELDLKMLKTPEVKGHLHGGEPTGMASKTPKLLQHLTARKSHGQKKNKVL